MCEDFQALVDKKLEEIYEIFLERRRKKREIMQGIADIVERRLYTDKLFGKDREEFINYMAKNINRR